MRLRRPKGSDQPAASSAGLDSAVPDKTEAQELSTADQPGRTPQKAEHVASPPVVSPEPGGVEAGLSAPVPEPDTDASIPEERPEAGAVQEGTSAPVPEPNTHASIPEERPEAGAVQEGTSAPVPEPDTDVSLVSAEEVTVESPDLPEEPPSPALPEPRPDGSYTFGPEGRLSPIPPSLVADRNSTSRPDTSVDWADLPQGDLRAVSTRGHMHRYLGEVREDSYGVELIQDHLVLAVCDGVGSASHSHEGSALAASEVGKHLSTLLPLAAGPAAVEVDLTELAAQLDDLAARLGVEPSDVSTTLVAAAVANDATSDGARTVTILQIGDSTAWRLAGNTWTRLGPTADEGADPTITNAVEPLPQYANATAWTETFAPGETLALVSDGVGNLLDIQGDYAAFLGKIWETSAPYPSLLVGVVDGAVKSYDDDRTFVGIRFRS